MRDLRAATCEALAGLDDRGMLDRTRNDVSGLAGGAHGTNQGEIVGFSAAGGEDDLGRRSADQRCDLCTRFVHRCARHPSFLMQARRISVRAAEKWPHRLKHSRIEWRW